MELGAFVGAVVVGDELLGDLDGRAGLEDVFGVLDGELEVVDVAGGLRRGDVFAGFAFGFGGFAGGFVGFALFFAAEAEVLLCVCVSRVMNWWCRSTYRVLCCPSSRLSPRDSSSVLLARRVSNVPSLSSCASCHRCSHRSHSPRFF